MGLLDEAIREHLELKRRAGADPSEIARAEHEALEPIFPPEVSAEEDLEAPGAPTEHGAPVEAIRAEGGVQPVSSAENGGQDLSVTGQETMELDMKAFLDADLEHPSTGSELRDWEVSGEAEGQALPEQVPGQERLSFE